MKNRTELQQKSKDGKDGENTGFHRVKSIADELDVSEPTVMRWIERGQLTAHKIGSTIRIADNDYRSFLAVNRRQR